MSVLKLCSAICFFLFFCFSAVSQKKSDKDFWKGNTWAAGIGTGILYVSGDVPAEKFTAQQTIEMRKQFVDWFAAKLNYAHANARGMQWLPSENFAKNAAWSSKYAAPVRMSNGTIQYGYNNNGTFTAAPAGEKVYYNYKTSVNTILLSGQFTLPIPFEEPRVGLSAALGAGALFYNVKVNTLNNSGTTYKTLFTAIASNTNKSKNEILKELKEGMDKSYETNAEDYNKQPHFIKQFGLGASYRFKQKFELTTDYAITLTKSDLLDGQRWQEYAYGDAVLTRDWDWLISYGLSIRYYFK